MTQLLSLTEENEVMGHHLRDSYEELYRISGKYKNCEDMIYKCTAFGDLIKPAFDKLIPDAGPTPIGFEYWPNSQPRERANNHTRRR